jgi:hypothetical protein
MLLLCGGSYERIRLSDRAGLGDPAAADLGAGLAFRHPVVALARGIAHARAPDLFRKYLQILDGEACGHTYQR